VGDPFRPTALDPGWLAWNTGTVSRLAQAAYEQRSLPAGTLDNARLAILADTLEEAGCADAGLLGHLRSGGDHYRGCFAVSALKPARGRGSLCVATVAEPVTAAGQPPQAATRCPGNPRRGLADPALRPGWGCIG
jgi:hypothetical protein